MKECCHNAVDPVCGMKVNPQTAKWKTEFQGTTFFFCNPKCLEKFRTNPESYVLPRPSKPLPSNDSITFTCPMHPEIKKQGSGTCPICGMALEPMHPSSELAPPEELNSMRKRFWWSLPFGLMVFALEMSEMFGVPRNDVWQFVLTVVPLMAAAPIFSRAASSIRTRNINMFTLIGLGTSIAFVYSTLALFFPEVFPTSALNPHSGKPSVYFEAVSSILVLVLLGQVLELKARYKTGEAIRKLIGLTPQQTTRLTPDGREEVVPVTSIQIGDKLIIKPGDKFSVDGIVQRGNSFVDESMLSGEAIEVEKRVGSPVSAGTVNHSGRLEIIASKVGSKTLLSQIIHLVSEAQRTQAPIQRLADEVSRYFVPGVLLSAVVTFLVWWKFGPSPSLAFAVVNAISVLIIACPCALGLATPMSITVAAGVGANRGILFRNAQAIETLGRVNVLVFDKTGTLTLGKPTVVDSWFSKPDETTLLKLLAVVADSSRHPLSRAVASFLKAKFGNDESHSISEAVDFPGLGFRATVDGKNFFLGSRSWLEKNHVTNPISDSSSQWEEASLSVVYASVNGEVIARFALTDPIKPEALTLMKKWKTLGLRTVLATGDHATVANRVAQDLGISEVHAGILPAEKANLIKTLREESSNRVAMIGDGINDAPALANAHVGVAMGTGTDIAIETAGVTLLRGELPSLNRAIELSRACLKNIRENLFFALIYNVVGIFIAAGVLYPFFGIFLSPMFASVAMTFSSVSVIANSLRLRHFLSSEDLG